ncbi:helix-turn-helix domain-containing protein [Curtobacterium sp. MCBD17_028]|uniref:helix-turn-helix domain-containing protein n=1 Tax=Curtobacterium sp. MCBD17_028 TaxID=2175670 RepID=UPI000DA9B739|nr:helix-turn-helix domain-containing protein [Curtobacterium sp. MCBD17_028]PZE23879.1 hypothetical protein DEI86_13630 [Curtobacterium sp. MCBD17_028]
MAADVTADAYFAIVPEWVLDSGVSGNAVKLYAILRRYADNATGEAHPSRRTLATRMGFSRPQSIDPIVQELVQASAVSTFERWTHAGDQDSNGYHVRTQAPHRVVRQSAPPVVRQSARGVVRETAHKPEPVELEPEELEGPRKRGSRLPESFAVDDVMRQWAKVNAPSVDVVAETEIFREHWGSKAGRDAVKVNWRLTWQTWMRRQHGWNVDRGWKPTTRAANVTDEVLAEQKAAWCAEHGITVAEWDAHEGDEAWRAEVIRRGGSAG